MSELQQLLTKVIYIITGLKAGGGDKTSVFSDGSDQFGAWGWVSYQHHNISDVVEELGKIRAGLDDLKRTIESCLKERENERDLLDAAGEMLVLLDPDLNVLAFNREAVRGLGIAEGEGERGGITETIRPDLEVIRNAAQNLFESRRTITWETDDRGRRLVKRACPIGGHEGRVGKIALGMREHAREKQMETDLAACREKLYHLASELAMTEARERRALASDIHDRICQALFLANMKIEGVRRYIVDSKGEGALEEVALYIGQAMEEAREMIMNISPPSLTMLGLEPALGVLAGEIQKKHLIEVDYYNDGLEKPLSEDVRDLVYRAARELMINAVKHARANKIILSCASEPDGIHIIVEDDGIGFDVGEILRLKPQTAHFGLFCICQRLGPLGGKLTILSGSGEGTRAELFMPLKTAEPNKSGGLT